jgi:hypothetical protein
VRHPAGRCGQVLIRGSLARPLQVAWLVLRTIRDLTLAWPTGAKSLWWLLDDHPPSEPSIGGVCRLSPSCRPQLSGALVRTGACRVPGSDGRVPPTRLLPGAGGPLGGGRLILLVLFGLPRSLFLRVNAHSAAAWSAGIPLGLLYALFQAQRPCFRYATLEANAAAVSKCQPFAKVRNDQEGRSLDAAPPRAPASGRLSRVCWAAALAPHRHCELRIGPRDAARRLLHQTVAGLKPASGGHPFCDLVSLAR